MAENTFWKLLKDLGAEHDRQLTGLITLVRELRLELNAATVVDRDILNLRSENMELKRQLALTPEQSPKHLPDSKEHAMHMVAIANNTRHVAIANNTRHELADSHRTNGSGMVLPVDAETQPTVATPICEVNGVEQIKDGQAGCNASPDLGQVKGIPPMPTMPTRSSIGATEPEESGLQRRLAFIDGYQFEALTGVLILINTLCMMVEAQYVGLGNGYITNFPGINTPVEDDWPGAAVAFLIIDRLFTVIFTVELALRFLRYKLELFKNPLNWIDITAVLASLAFWIAEDYAFDPAVLRLLRVARLMRGIRILKSKKLQGSLSILIKCVQASGVTLFWSLCLLVMVQCIIGMAVGHVAHGFIVDLSNPEVQRHELYRYYGTFMKAFITMFEVHMANWATPARVLINNVGELYGYLFVFYRCGIGFALMNVIGAVFVQQAMAVQQQDQDLMILKKQKEAESYSVKLKALFDSLDKDGDGTLSRDEFDAVTRDTELKAWMEALDINPDDLQGLFDLLDTGDGQVSADEFLMGATRVRGTARNIDVAHLMVTAQRLERMVEKTQSGLNKLDSLEAHLHEALQALKCKDNVASSSWAVSLPRQLLPETGLKR